jgi:hypothetical protein
LDVVEFVAHFAIRGLIDYEGKNFLDLMWQRPWRTATASDNLALRHSRSVTSRSLFLMGYRLAGRPSLPCLLHTYYAQNSELRIDNKSCLFNPLAKSRSHFGRLRAGRGHIRQRNQGCGKGAGDQDGTGPFYCVLHPKCSEGVMRALATLRLRIAASKAGGTARVRINLMA